MPGKLLNLDERDRRGVIRRVNAAWWVARVRGGGLQPNAPAAMGVGTTCRAVIAGVDTEDVEGHTVELDPCVVERFAQALARALALTGHTVYG